MKSRGRRWRAANDACNSNAYSDPAHSGRETRVETLSHRHIGVAGEGFASVEDAFVMFGVLDLERSFEGFRFAIGIRNANNKRSMLAWKVGL